MKKVLVITSAILLLAAACNKQPAELVPMQNQDDTANWKIFSETYSGATITFKLPTDWNSLSLGWNKNDPIHLYDLNGYVSKESAEYNQNVICPKPPTGAAGCKPHDPRYDLTIRDIWTSGKSFPVSTQINGLSFYDVSKQPWSLPDRTEYAIQAETNQFKEIHYYILSFDKNLKESLKSQILSNFKFTMAGQSSVYETQFLKVTIPAGWIAAQAASNPAAVNITKGNYILYINTQASQASGIEGGRFGEIASGAPSADAVVTEQPSPPCGTSEKSPAFGDYSRMDLYVNNQAKESYCHTPSNGATVWYFSYLTRTGGYFNYYNADQPPGLVVTMAYNSKVVNAFPVKGSTGLNSVLNEMTNIVKSLEVKQK